MTPVDDLSRRIRCARTVRVCARLRPACGGARWRRDAQDTLTAVPLHHLSCVRQLAAISLTYTGNRSNNNVVFAEIIEDVVSDRTGVA